MAYIYIPWLMFFQLLIQVAKHEAKVPAIIVFGDSTVDSGNNNRISTVLKSNFRPYGRDFAGGQATGRFSNGRVPPDFFSEAFGLKPFVPAYLDPKYNMSDFVTGVCFASAGTGYDNATSDVLNVIPLWKEVEYYKEYQAKLRDHVGEEKAGEILGEALYVISLGTNDFLENYYLLPRRKLKHSVGQYQDFLVKLAENFLREIFGLGVRKISITGLPPMGCLPLERAANVMGHHECVKEYNDAALEFNVKLNDMIEKLNEELEGFRILFTKKVYELVYQMIKTPSKFGFDVTEVACCSTGTFEMSYLCSESNPYTCKDANKYLFWDAFHPTEKTNKIVSDSLIPDLLAQFN